MKTNFYVEKNRKISNNSFQLFTQNIFKNKKTSIHSNIPASEF